ncbi:MAG: putative toxin-antitoxin system toxin component, PIN family [Gammaproteobacteria bacterium]|nr:putative toxin-antitoxin system toxin component, PIN family [Gammaproteobacteria bacterium]
MRIVVDTNLWVSYLLRPHSPLAFKLDELTRAHRLLYSRATATELATVLTRPKFAPYINYDDAQAFVAAFIEAGEAVTVSTEIHACRDPRDNKFLELAVSANADCIISGDEDLLVLHPFRDIAIQRLTDF